MNEGNSVSVEITDIAFPNDYGVAKKDGKVIFVPGGVVGDIACIVIAKEGKGYAYGLIEAIKEPSPFRTAPACPHFGACGGCTLQNLAYEKQLELKANYLTQTLRRIGGIEVDSTTTLPIEPSPDKYFYRNKVDLAFGVKDGKTILGMRERASSFQKYGAAVVPVEICPLFSPVVKDIVPVVNEFAGREGLVPYNSATGKGVLRHLIVRESKTTGEIMVTLETAQRKVKVLSLLFDALNKAAPGVKSVYLAVNNRHGDAVCYNQLQRIAGQSYITENIADMTLRIYPQSFFQPNTKAAETLYGKIAWAASLSGNENVLGLYCGMGPIELHLSRLAQTATGIDSLSGNIINAKENCQINNIGNCVFYAGTVEKVLRDIVPQKTDLLVIDPPRSGISREGMELIIKLKPPRITYVSCSPSTLARDLKAFLLHGYAISMIAPFDFFPHTSHLETLVYLTRT